MGSILRRGARASVAHVVALALVAGGAFAALTVSTTGAQAMDSCGLEARAQSGGVHICKSGPESAVAGTEITYTLDIDAWGNWNKNFEVDDTVPEGTSLVSVTPSDDVWDCSASADPDVVCTALDVDPDEVDDTSISVVVAIDSSFRDEGIENCATISRSYVPKELVESSDSSSDESCWWTDVTREYDVSIAKTGPASLVVPADITYTITATNSGPSDSDPVTFTDTLPAGTTLVNVDGGTAWDCSGSTATEVECTTLTGVPGNGSVSATVTLSVPVEHAGTALTNCATLESEVPAITATTQSCTTIEGANVTVKAADVIKPITGVAPRFTG
jgi:uncharacterized repeat protein (TIGR01451 family)